ncbi:MAG TPA: AsmA family protein, partial [Acetobacteraceae bacterium]|nr:AsmA family protein [Acetobacteraceae bacterium]
MPKRRRRPLLRALLAAVLLLVLVAVAAAVAATLLIDPNGFKPRIEAAVARATGGTLDLRGPLRIGFGLPPHLVADDITLAGPGGTGTLRLGRMEARVALLPLLTGEVDIIRLDLLRPDLTLATAPAPPSPPQPPPPPAAAAPAAPAGTTGTRLTLAVRAVHVADGVVRRGALTVGVPRLDAAAAAPGASLVLSGELVSAGRRLALSGETGPVEALLDPATTSPWPMEAVLQGEGARLAVRGSLRPPLGQLAYALQVDAAATDLAAVAPFLPVAVPKLHDVAVSARVAGAGRAVPQVSAVTLHVAGLDLGATLPGLMLVRADLVAPDLQQKVQADVQATLHGMPVNLRGTVG